MGSPASEIEPASGFVRPASIEISVVLPAPLYPTMATNSPSWIDRLMSDKTSVRVAPVTYDFEPFLGGRRAPGVPRFGGGGRGSWRGGGGANRPSGGSPPAGPRSTARSARPATSGGRGQTRPVRSPRC